MTEEELRRRFEELTLTADQFPHREHVRLAWTYLRELPLVEVLELFPRNLRRFAASVGAEGIYHETVTWTFLMIIAERIERSGERTSFAAFRDANADLLEKGFLERYYQAETLASEEAKRRFVWPDKVSG